MIAPEEILPDDKRDHVGRKIKDLQTLGTWTLKKWEAHRSLVESCRQAKYRTFVGGYERYQLSRVGQSLLYNVPVAKRGFLERYRGKLVRIVCTGHVGSWKREYMVGEVS